MHYVILATELERFCMVTHSSAVRFQQKYDFMKFTTVFISRTKQIYTKLLNIYESILKIKVMTC